MAAGAPLRPRRRPLVGRRLHAHLHLLLHRPLRRSPASSGPATGSPSCASPSAWSRSPSPASPPTSPSRRRRPGWRRKWACSHDVHRTTSKGWEVLGVGTAGALLQGPGDRQPGRRRALAALRLHARWWRCSSGAGCGPRLRPLLAALSAGDGPDPDGDRRALLLRRRCSAGSTPRAVMAGWAWWERAASRPAAQARASAALSASIASIGSGSTPRAAASSSETRSPSITAQSRRSVRLSPSRLDPHRRGAGGGDRLGGELEAPPHARVLVAVLEQHHREPGPVRQRRPAADLVVVGLRQLGEEGRQLGVLVELGLPAPRDRRGQAGAVDDRQRARRAARRPRRRGPAARRPLGLEEGGGRLDLGGDRAARPRPAAATSAAQTSM